MESLEGIPCAVACSKVRALGERASASDHHDTQRVEMRLCRLSEKPCGTKMREVVFARIGNGSECASHPGQSNAFCIGEAYELTYEAHSFKQYNY